MTGTTVTVDTDIEQIAGDLRAALRDFGVTETTLGGIRGIRRERELADLCRQLRDVGVSLELVDEISSGYQNVVTLGPPWPMDDADILATVLRAAAGSNDEPPVEHR